MDTLNASANPALKSGLLHRNMRVGLFGGSFDPVHEGHVHVAETALKRLQLDRIWWLVSPQNPLKSAEDMATSSVTVCPT